MHGVLECRLEVYQFYARAQCGPGLAAIAQHPRKAVTSGSGMGRPFSGLLDLECLVSACWPQVVAIVGGASIRRRCLTSLLRLCAMAAMRNSCLRSPSSRATASSDGSSVSGATASSPLCDGAARRCVRVSQKHPRARRSRSRCPRPSGAR